MTSTTGKQSLSKIAKSFESFDKTREANRCKDVKNYSNKPCSNNRDGRTTINSDSAVQKQLNPARATKATMLMILLKFNVFICNLIILFILNGLFY